MRQLTLATVGFEKHGKLTRRAAFLAEMEEVVPWRELCAVVEPFYPKRGNGRPPIGLERMLRLHFLQHWFNLSDLAVEEALYESVSMRRFAGIDLGREPVPDETTILNFRHLLNGTIVDATIIAAASSTKNQAKAHAQPVPNKPQSQPYSELDAPSRGVVDLEYREQPGRSYGPGTPWQRHDDA